MVLSADVYDRAGSHSISLKGTGLLSNIIAFYPDATLIIDNEGRVVSWNRAMEDMTGVKAEDMLGKGDYEYALPFYGKRRPILLNLLDSPPSEIDELYADVTIREGKLEATSFLVNLNGRHAILSGTASKLYDPEGNVVGAIESIRDVTGQKTAEEAMYESDRLLADIIDFLPDATFAIDREGMIVAWNRAIEEMTGAKAINMLGKGGHEYAYPFYGVRSPILIDLALKYDKEIAKKYSYVKKEGDVFLAETKLFKNGKDRVLWGKAGPLYDSKGCLVGAIESIRDITEQKMAEKALRDHADFLQVLMNAIPVPVFYKNDKGLYIGCNVAFEKFIGLTKKQLEGKTVSDISPKELAVIYRRSDEAIYQNRVKHEYESAVIHADGSKRDVIFYKAPFYHADGSLGGLIGTILDITERKDAEKELRRHKDHLEELIAERTADLSKVNEHLQHEIAERKQAQEELSKSQGFLNNVFECIQDGITVIDKDMNIIRFNHTVEKRFPNTRPIRGKKCYTAYHSRLEPCENCPCIKSMNEKTLQNGVVPFNGANGIFLGWIELYAFPIFDDDGNVIGVIEQSREITERIRSEEALKDAKAEAELYLDLMGHDINNLNQIGLGFLEMALDQPDLDERTRTLLSKPHSALASSSMLIDNVRKLRKARSGELHRLVIDVGYVLSEVKANHSQLPGREITINYENIDGCMVMANELLYDVFSNLVGNAIKHSARSPVINIVLSRVAEDGKLFYQISIEDNGPGISDDLKPRIFDRQLRGSTMAKGSGIGLYLVKTLVNSYGGSVRVEDRIPGDRGEGSRFVVMLPAHERHLDRKT